MFSKSTDQFELRLGKLGLTVFILGIACLVFVAFQFGIMLGKDMDAYPEKAASGFPAYIKQKITKQVPDSNMAAPNETKREETGNEKTDMNLTFYDTLAGKKQKVDLPQQNQTDEKVAAQEEISQEKPIPIEVQKEKLKEKPKEKENPKEKPASAKDRYFVQVVSLKDQKKAEEIRKNLAGMGYHAELDTKEVTGAKFYRVKLTGFEDRENALKAASAVEKKHQLKCMIKTKE